jgi:hypothetical protein
VVPSVSKDHNAFTFKGQAGMLDLAKDTVSHPRRPESATEMLPCTSKGWKTKNSNYTRMWLDTIHLLYAPTHIHTHNAAGADSTPISMLYVVLFTNLFKNI